MLRYTPDQIKAKPVQIVEQILATIARLERERSQSRLTISKPSATTSRDGSGSAPSFARRVLAGLPLARRVGQNQSRRSEDDHERRDCLAAGVAAMLALCASSARGQLATAEQVASIRSRLPALEAREWHDDLHSPDVVWYTDREIPRAYQHAGGFHSPSYNISADPSDSPIRHGEGGNANVQFPWLKAGGLDRSPDAVTATGLLLPRAKMDRVGPSSHGTATPGHPGMGRRVLAVDVSRGNCAFRNCRPPNRGRVGDVRSTSPLARNRLVGRGSVSAVPHRRKTWPRRSRNAATRISIDRQSLSCFRLACKSSRLATERTARGRLSLDTLAPRSCLNFRPWRDSRTDATTVSRRVGARVGSRTNGEICYARRRRLRADRAAAWIWRRSSVPTRTPASSATGP